MPRTISQLNDEYNQAEEADRSVFARQRSNVRLYSGFHFKKTMSSYWTRVRTLEGINEKRKLRIAKNHVRKICNILINSIITYSPSVGIGPKNKQEHHDRKVAELHQSVLRDIHQRHKYRKLKRDLAEDYVIIGEMILKTGFDYLKGPKVSEETIGQNEDGTPVTRPVFAGDWVNERVFGFNLLRDPGCQSMDEARWMIIRKVMDINDLRATLKGDEDKQRMVEESSRTTFKVFDATTGDFTNSRKFKQALVREHYFRPSSEYPNGYYYICTEKGVLFEGELPFGYWPIIYAGYDRIPTKPRHSGVIETIRNNQIEINRCASQIATHQTTIGDDKLIIQKGSTMSEGGKLHGVRGIEVTGAKPDIIEGRSGAQYMGWLEYNVNEMYELANVKEELQEKGQLKPFMMLFARIRDKKKFVLYTEKMEEFLVEDTELKLRYAKKYYRPEALIPVIGKRERVNVPEFKSADDLSYEIEALPQTEDAESKLGRALTFQQIMQYGGDRLTSSTLGLLIKNHPYVNIPEITSDLTIDYDIAENMILAIDRGEVPDIEEDENHTYMIKRLTKRMKEPDFDFLNDQTKEVYKLVRKQYYEFEIENQQKIARAQAGFIPTTGGGIKIDINVQKPGKPTQTMRLMLPHDGILWLKKRLEEQGTMVQEMSQLPTSDAGNIAQMFALPGPQTGGQGIPPGRSLVPTAQ